MRVAVEFGKRKIFTALVHSIHQNPPIGYEAKDIHQILDEAPVVNELQLNHWEWLASYYMCTLGEVFRAAVPTGLLLESETEISLDGSKFDENVLDSDEFLIVEALQHQATLSIQLIGDILDKKHVFPVVKGLLQKQVIQVKETIYEQYKPKLVKYVKLSRQFESDSSLDALLKSLSRAKKQREIVMTYFLLSANDKEVKVKDLLKRSNATNTILNSLIKKSVFEPYFLQTDRVQFNNDLTEIKKLSSVQELALENIHSCFKSKDVVLLKGVTSSGKTEIYTKLIKESLQSNKQVLYLLPEIALTTQLIERLKVYFGNYLVVYHSKYSVNERIEVWNNVLENKEKGRLVLGVRSALFLPFSNLDLVIVDEEHEPSFKQNNPAPRYHARDAVTVLAHQHKAKVLMGSATPSLETYYNAKQDKYGLVHLDQRFGNVQLPEIELVDIKEKHRKKRMKGHFSDRLLEMMDEALEAEEQIILFQNRRGFAPIVACETCGNSPQCIHCDVSLTYHSFKNELRCHYCGHRQAMLHQCGACGSEKLNTKGFGTEQIEMELNTLYPEVPIGRMDLDTTRGKYGYQKIISKFQAQEIRILIGTQMLSKGLDFANVSMVGILNADNLLNFPDFRAHERSYQLLVQVSGRAGRATKRGKVAIQSYNPYHQILQQVTTSSYDEMYKEQLDERWQFHYPPFYRIIKITVKHKDFNKVETGAQWLGKAFSPVFKSNFLGPTTPAISKIRNLYIRHMTIKIPQGQSLKATKSSIEKVKTTFHSIKEFRSIRIIIDVDSY